jgi:aspartate 1-decarboxylase
VQVGDVIIIIAYGHMTPEEAANHQPKLVFPDTATNKLLA